MVYKSAPQVIRKGKVGETYNIGGINEWANIDIVKLICKLMDEQFQTHASYKTIFPEASAAHHQNSDSLITYVKDRPGHDRRYAIDPTRANNVLGYHPQESFETGIRKTINWYLANQGWWQAVMDGSYQEWVDSQYG